MSAVCEHFALIPDQHGYVCVFTFWYEGVPYVVDYPKSTTILTNIAGCGTIEYMRHVDSARRQFLTEVHIRGLLN